MSDVIVEITYDGTDLFADDGTVGFRFTRGAPGEPPLVRGEDDTVAARPGRVAYPRVLDYLPIGLEGWVHAPDGLTDAEAFAATETARRAILGAFASTTATAVLSAVLADGAVATINARVVPPILVKELVPGLRYELDVALESVDPDWVIEAAGS